MGGKLPKSIIKKYGITKKAWQVFRGTHHSSGKSSMPKKKRRYRRLRRFGRRVAKTKTPFETLIAGVAIPFTPAASGWQSPFEYAQQGNVTGIMHSLKKGFIGMEPDGRMDIFKTLNPLDMECGRYSKMLIYASLIGMIRRKIAGRYMAPMMKKIPIIGRSVG